MRWPWISRLAYELLLDERDRLRVQNAELVDALTRITRKGQGLPELPRQEKPRPQDGAGIPRELREFVERFASSSMRNAIWDQVRILRADGAEWADILQRLRDGTREVE